MKDLAKRLIESFRDREYRESYAEEFLSSWISQQLTAVRRQRGKTQQQLGDDVGTKQSGISRMERVDYGRWNFATLQKAAFALDCRLRVSLETFGSLVEEAADLSEAKLRRPSFDQDPVFHVGAQWDPDLAEPGPIGEMRRKLIPWLRNEGPLETLGDWLQGYNLPLAGDETPPSEWLLKALTPGDEHLKDVLAERVSRFIQESRWDKADPGKRQARVVRNVFALAEILHRPSILGPAIWAAYRRRKDIPFPGSDEPGPEHPLIRALTYNQPVDSVSELWPFWKSRFLAERDGREMPEYVAAGLTGVSYLGSSAPNILALVEAANQAKRWDVTLGLPRIIDILDRAFRRLWSEFPDCESLKIDVVATAASMSDGWSAPILAAWYRSVDYSLPPINERRMIYVTQAARIAYMEKVKSLTAALLPLAA